MIILTVEDEYLISEYLRSILESGGHTVIATFDADEAVRVLEKVRGIQLVITETSICRAPWTGCDWRPQSGTDGPRSTSSW
jgi:CheY-like chemotaxis protein